MLKNILGSIVFVVVVLALINFIGDAMVDPATSPQSPSPLKAEIQAPTPESAKVSDAAPEADQPEEVEPEAVEPKVVEPQETERTIAMAGDAAAGKNIFRKKCMGCHTATKGEPDRTGPNLWDVVGRKKGASPEYRYSTPMKALGGVWNEADILGFIAGPRTFLPDTKMTFAGIKNEQERADILAFLNTLKD
ncbi:MAG: cytochrome c family protein [Rhodospirillales bacterium]|nr:cytochrome c family protein [Rhodospirillales bacterium]